jgi:hypothetical protein
VSSSTAFLIEIINEILTAIIVCNGIEYLK